MILSQQVERLTPLLAQLPALVTAYQRRDPDFPDRAAKWIDEAEKLMSRLHLPGSSELAMLKGRILKADEALPWDGNERPARSRGRSARNVAAMEALERAEEILRCAVLDAEERLRKFEDKLCEGMTALALQVHIPLRYSPAAAWLTEVWGLLSERGPTLPLATYLAASLSMVDRLYLLNIVLSRLQEPPPQPDYPDEPEAEPAPPPELLSLPLPVADPSPDESPCEEEDEGDEDG